MCERFGFGWFFGGPPSFLVFFSLVVLYCFRLMKSADHRMVWALGLPLYGSIPCSAVPAVRSTPDS